MKGITKNILSPLLLILGIVFGAMSIASPLLTQPALAVDEEVPTTSDITTDDTTTPDTDVENSDNATNSDATDETADETTEEDDTDAEETNTAPVNVCTDQAGGLSWIVCPTTEFIAGAVDVIYSAIGDLLAVQPVSMEDNSPIYIIWKYVLNITNTVFVIFLLIVIISQITGFGISNYGVKRVLPRLVIAVILMNLSFLICTLAVDVSNILGSSLREFFSSIQDDVLAATQGTSEVQSLDFGTIVATILGAATIPGLAIGAIGGWGTLFWMLIVVLLSAIVSVITGLITIAARQAVVALLIMMAPLAFAAYLLPNTEKWFVQWKNLLVRMLVFYPAFSFLYGASQLVGWALIASANNGLGVILGLGVQVFPLFFSWSLMKMSGTILGTFNDALRRATRPIQAVGTRWGLEHAEQHRQRYLGQNDLSSGARLRQYLDYRRELRLNDTKNSAEVRHDRAIERAMRTSASVIDRDEKGNTRWTVNPNRYARTAKSASYHHTMASNANMVYQNTLSGYGRHFVNDHSQRLAGEHAEGFLDSMAQSYLAANEAEADQQWLLNQYLGAINNSPKNSYMYNRLIKDAAGGLEHNGESSIMGQVIIGNSNIENRRRAEARVMITKFGIDKTKFRAMVYNKAFINDDGIETDANGTKIEDSEYNLITHDAKGNPTGFKRQKWPHYIVVNKVTDETIDKDIYLAMSDEEKKGYKEVRYYDILDDNKNPVQRVFFDDAGYMKELLRDDIAIGDPINRRYLTEIGVDENDTSKAGGLRKYHSTISAAMLETRYKEHAAGVTPMVTAQTNRGYVTSKGQYNIAELQSITVASKTGALVQNDGKNIDQLTAFMTAMQDDAAFAKYFPDEDIMAYRNVNGQHLDGLRLAFDAENNPYWQEINHNDPDISLEDRKNLVRHKILPKAAAKLIGSLNRSISQGALDNMKPDGLKALLNMVDTLSEMAIKNAKTEQFTERFNGDMDIFDNHNPSILRARITNTQDLLRKLGNNPNSNDTTDGGTTDSGSGPSTPTGGSGGGSPTQPQGPTGSSAGSAEHRMGYTRLKNRLQRHNDAQQQYVQRNSRITIDDVISSYFDYATDYDTVAQSVQWYFQNTECLQPLLRDCEEAIERNRFNDTPSSTDDAIYQSTHTRELELERIQSLRADIENLIDQAETF